MPLAPDQQLFEYRIVRQLGQGGFGAVYLAHDTLLDRPVAIKELTVTKQTDEQAFKRFLQEARTAGGLNHPNVVTIYALKVEGPYVYPVMEYVGGGSLRRLLEKQGKLDIEQAVKIAIDVCEGLAAVHAKGIVHRDIKPENILLTEEGRAKVSDFGIAHVPRGAGGTGLTQAGFQPGTLVYMSPEQVLGKPVDTRSDVYQVGELLYEMLVGKHYIDLAEIERLARDSVGSNALRMQAKVFELLADAVCVKSPAALKSLRKETPDQLAAIVEAALAKNPAQRPADGKALSHQLTDWLSGRSQQDHVVDANQGLPTSMQKPGRGAKSPAPRGPSERLAIVPQIMWELPKIEDIFELGEASVSEEELLGKASIIEATLHHLGVEAKTIEINRGPRFAQFGLEPGWVTSQDSKQTKVKVSRIKALADDLQLALAAPTIRIEAPVPGRNIVGIEVPNTKIAMVTLRDVMESAEFHTVGHKSKLVIALGQDMAGRPVAADLAAMPHLLIAGTTGSGKSVCVNAIISCLLARNTPDDLRLLMVDPKRVELTGYNGIPHLMVPVVVDLERVVGVLQWVTREMDIRYRKFAKASTRNIDDFNVRITAQKDALGGSPGPAGDAERLEKLPYIVVIIDELADLMMLAPDETERTICRLAQTGHAVGIHLIITTWRPSDVITRPIKGSFPVRISFAVASSVDSRLILDRSNAEPLLGRGDMLFVSPDSGQPVRLQGCFVSDKEILKLVRHWKGVRGLADAEQPAAKIPLLEAKSAVQPPLWEKMRTQLEKTKESQEDGLLERAIEVARLQRRVSISLLQRKLQIGYTRAAHLIDLMEQRGIIGPAVSGERWRDVL